MPDADLCRRALTPVEEAALFAGDALRAAGIVMAGAASDATPEHHHVPQTSLP